ncbi:MAG: TVP38/TMEM64 family protein [Candidatus Lokiarchaeota archaeon]|nr:TVP38/TMEM64 family protein [Candidatus Lokiarchaeota archaeon]
MNIKEILKDKKTYYMLLFLVIVAATGALLVVWIFNKNMLATIAIYMVMAVVWAGFWGVFIYFGVMAVQSMLVPIPSELILLMTGILWGSVGGTLLGIGGSIFTGALAYYITLRGGRPIAEKLVPKRFLEPLDNLIKRYGTWFIFIMRAVPLMAFDPISYASGLLKINFKKYMIATVVGSVPRALFYALLGQLMMSGAPGNYRMWGIPEWQLFLADPLFGQFADTFNLIFILILGLLVAMFLVYNFVLGPLLRKKGEAQATRTNGGSPAADAAPPSEGA